jgi:hypothetical protein
VPVYFPKRGPSLTYVLKCPLHMFKAILVLALPLRA